MLAGAAVGYVPSVLVAHYRSSPVDALVAPEALAGMLLAGAAIGWRRRGS